jgi:hypothetical protein
MTSSPAFAVRLGAALVFGLLAALPSSALTVDAFGGSPFSSGVVVGSPGGTFDRAFGSMIGGDREYMLTGSGSAQILGFYRETTSSSGGSTTSASLVWDGSGPGDTNGLDFNLGLDLSSLGVIGVGGEDTRPSSAFQITLYTSSQIWTRMVLGLPNCTPDNCASGSSLAVALASGTNGPGGGVDLTHVNAIQANTVGGAGTHTNLTYIVFVEAPEPAAAALLLPAGALLLRRRRR